MVFHEYAVGKLYHPGRTTWDEGGDYNFRGGGHELRLFYVTPSETEIYRIKKGEAQFALTVLDGIIFFLYRFGGGSWSDASDNWWLVPESDRVLPNMDLSANDRGLLTILLVNAANGILQAIRTASLSPDLTRRLHEAIWQQSTQPFDEQAHVARIKAIYQQYPESADLERIAEAKCFAGE